MDRKTTAEAAAQLLLWYGANRRNLPWRAPTGGRPDPYHVWLSEIMLQQTTVAAVIPYFQSFIRRWPDVEALAAASLDEVLHGWQGLGYYVRARNLHICARRVVTDMGGCFPADEAALRRLPGIGAYTAAAVAAIAFGLPAAPVDANIERVVARLFGVRARLPKAKPRIKVLAADLAASLGPGVHPGDHAQALMDLGAGVCTTGTPHCGVCPLAEMCRANASGTAHLYPKTAPKKPTPTRHGWAFWTHDIRGRVLLRRRPETGLLGGMMEFPSTRWTEIPLGLSAAIAAAPVKADWRPLPGLVRHAFTHFHLELRLLAGEARGGGLGPRHVWSAPDNFGNHALPTLMKKVARHALRTVT